MNRAELFRLARAGRLAFRRISIMGATKDVVASKISINDSSLLPSDRKAFELGYFDNFRSIVKVSGDAFMLDGGSWLNIKPASLLSFNGNIIIGYSVGHSKLTPEESKVLEEWKAYLLTPEMVKNRETDAMTDSNYCYNEKQIFFESRSMKHLMGFEYSRGRKLDLNLPVGTEEIVLDTAVKGTEEYVYEFQVK